jgi:type IV secretion system protein VirB4
MIVSLRSAQRPSAIRREQAVASHIPYAAHVAEGILKTSDGDFVQSFRLSGASFESADDDQLNNWHERLNVTWRNVASPNVALWIHLIRRREQFAGASVDAVDFAGRLAAKYQSRLATETLMVNDLYLSVVY